MKPTEIYWKELHKVVKQMNHEKSSFERAKIAAEWVDRKREQAYREAREAVRENLQNLVAAGADFVYNDVIMLLSTLSQCKKEC